jgi:nucleoside-diphosphate-sugar epimerase
MDESHPLVAQSPYAATKVAADQLAGSYFRSFDVPVTTLRPFNTFGPRQSMRAVLPTLMVQALYSDRIMVGSLDPVRDMNYVADTVGAFVAAASAEGVEGEVFNIGSGRGQTVREMLDSVQSVVGVELPVVHEPARIRPDKSEVRALICDFKKATSAFSYEPTVDFEDGLMRLRDYLLAEGSPVDINAYRV